MEGREVEPEFRRRSRMAGGGRRPPRRRASPPRRSPSPPDAEPRKPTRRTSTPNLASVLYNGMIAPIIPYGIEGAIWYQGESNAGNPWQYRTLFPAMITDWRKHWSAANPTRGISASASCSSPTSWPASPTPCRTTAAGPACARRSTMTLKLPNTGEAVIIDIGQADDIHPKDKMDVGHRLALAALHVTYDKDIVYSGPTYDKHDRRGQQGPLKLQQRRRRPDDRRRPLHPARRRRRPSPPASSRASPSPARTRSSSGPRRRSNRATRSSVWSDEVSKPVAVRYAWANNPECNLYNKEGLPASPFRTDDWPIVEGK